MIFKKQHHNDDGLGFADFFQDRHKKKIFDLANLRPNDRLYDLGCGDAKLLIFAVKEFGVRNAIGFERNPQRRGIAKKNIEKEKLDGIISLEKEFDDADLTKADVILSTLPEDIEDFDLLWSQKIKKGTRLIRHDLPIIGYLPNLIDIPFYRMTFPLKKARTKDEWASAVMQRKSRINDVWHELYYYSYERQYFKRDIQRFQKITSIRFR